MTNKAAFLSDVNLWINYKYPQPLALDEQDPNAQLGGSQGGSLPTSSAQLNALDLLIMAFQTARDSLQGGNSGDDLVNAFLNTISDVTGN